MSLEERVLATLPAPPLWIAAIVGASVFLLYLGTGLLLESCPPPPADGTPLWRIPNVRETLVLSVLLGWALATEPLARRNVARLLETIRPSLAWSDGEFRAGLGEALALHAVPRRLGALLGLGLGAWVSIATDPEPFAWQGPRAHEDLWQLALNMAICLLFARGVYATLYLGRRCAAVAREAVQVDLLDTTPLKAFTRYGLRASTLWVVGGSLVALFFLNWGFSVYTALGVTATLGMASAVVLRPVRAVHQRIRSEKRAALERVNHSLRRDHALVLEPVGSGATEAANRLPGLHAYRDFVAALPEWPFDLSSWLRSALLLAVAIGSWLGGALVERMLGAALD